MNNGPMNRRNLSNVRSSTKSAIALLDTIDLAKELKESERWRLIANSECQRLKDLVRCLEIERDVQWRENWACLKIDKLEKQVLELSQRLL